MRNFFSTDGEAIIMNNAYKDEVIAAFDDAQTDYGRVGASTTGIHNACDRAYTFRETKKSVRELTKKGGNISNYVLEQGIQKAFENLKRNFLSLHITSQYIKNITDGLLTLTRTYQETMTPQMVKTGFSVCGQHCDPKEPDGVTVDFEKMMYQCYSDISISQMELMNGKTQYFSDIMKREGRVTYNELKNEGIYCGTTTINRDDLAPVRHMLEIVNHEKTVQRFRDYVAARRPESVQKRKQAARDFKNQQKQHASKTKEIEKQNKRDQRLIDVETEKQRKLTLTPEERAREKAAKRELQHQKAEQKQAALQSELAAALERKGMTVEI